jgi:1-acyl-sn-glycerol-3-phosphate acyltransferase
VIGTGRALPPDVYRLRRVPGGLVVRFGPPIDPADLPPGLERKEQLEALTERVELAIRGLLERAPSRADELCAAKLGTR